MTLKFYNYLTRELEEFKPINPPNVTLYTCGPTVYDFVHIGNWRTFIFDDVLRRTLEFEGFKVKQVMNITDIDDKIIKGSQDAGLEFKEFIKPFEKQFFQDLGKLNIKKAHLYPKATENIPEMINLIEKLLEKGFVYKTSDGVYFDISNFPNYGRLSNLEKRKLKTGARISADLYEKDDASDFALWKFSSSRRSSGQVLQEPTWDAPFGRGRPGWHIECSAMSMKYLGESIDIHTGGVDLLFPHHENEIAQSEAATSKKFVNFWLEGEHLLLSEQKMAKSLGNIVTLKDLERNIPKGPFLSFRYLCLTTHYRSKLNFTWGSFEAANRAMINIGFQVSNLLLKRTPRKETVVREYLEKFINALNNDLDTPTALAVFWDIIKSDLPGQDTLATILEFDKVLGLNINEIIREKEKVISKGLPKLPKGAKELIAKREKLRVKGNFTAADRIRSQLKKMGVLMDDTPEGTKWKIKKPD